MQNTSALHWTLLVTLLAFPVVASAQNPTEPLRADSSTNEPKHQSAGQALVLLDLQGGSRRSFDFGLSYDVTHFSSHLAYLQSPQATFQSEKGQKRKTDVAL